MSRYLLWASFCVLSSVSSTSCADDCANVAPEPLADAQMEIAAAEDRALRDYFGGSPEQSADSLGLLLKAYQSGQCNNEVTDEMRSAFKYDELLTHARLARQHQKLGNKAKASTHAERAVALGRVVFGKKSWSAVDLSALLNDVDRRARPTSGKDAER